VSVVSLVSVSHESPDGVVQEPPPDPDILLISSKKVLPHDYKQHNEFNGQRQ
jgi:hypothetical protein